VPRESRARSKPHSLHHRQPEREKRRKRGACIDPPGFDAGKDKKRHVLVDTQGLLLHGIVTAADVQDRDGGLELLATLFGLFPFLGKLLADSAYQGPIFHGGLAGILPTSRPRSSSNPIGSGALSSSPGVGWSNAPSLAQPLPPIGQGLGKPNRNALAFLKLASIRLMLRKLCNPP